MSDLRSAAEDVRSLRSTWCSDLGEIQLSVIAARICSEEKQPPDNPMVAAADSICCLKLYLKVQVLNSGVSHRS